MAVATENLPSLNEANERDPYNNNCYGTLVDSDYKLVTLPILDVRDFNERIIRENVYCARRCTRRRDRRGTRRRRMLHHQPARADRIAGAVALVPEP